MAARNHYRHLQYDSYDPLAQVCNWTDEDGESRQQTHYFHCDQIGIPREMTDSEGNLVWFDNYTGWARLKEETRVTDSAYQPFRLQNQYYDEETGLHYNFFRYYEPDAGRFINQDPIRLIGGDNLYQFADNIQKWNDPLGLWRRNAYLARTPSKVSATGCAVMKRILRDKLITGITEKQIDALTRTSKISKDAVDYWNRCGRVPKGC